MAIAWVVNTGIYQKMEKDVTNSQALRPHFEEAFWSPDLLRSSTVLRMNHLLLLFLLLVVLLLVSVVIFLCELALKKKDANLQSRRGKGPIQVSSSKLTSYCNTFVGVIAILKKKINFKDLFLQDHSEPDLGITYEGLASDLEAKGGKGPHEIEKEVKLVDLDTSSSNIHIKTLKWFQNSEVTKRHLTT